MGALKRMGIVLGVVAALGVPSAASAFSFSDWLRDFFRPKKERTYRPRTTSHPMVPEPTAALLFGIGAAVVAARARKAR